MTTAQTLAEEAFQRAFGSLTPMEVFSLREGQAWRLLRGDDPHRFASLLSIADLDAFLQTDAARSPRVAMADGGREGSAAVPFEDYLEEGSDRIDLPRLLARFDQGATLVVSQFHDIHPPLARFCRGLEKVFLHPVQANIYLTPPGGQGFRRHFDTHDVLVLQVSGRKSWRVWNDIPFPRPTRHTPWTNSIQPEGEACPLDLQPGDALYLPRGVIHEAMVQEGGEASLHITVGFLEPGLAEMLRGLIAELEGEEPAWRFAVPTWRLPEEDGVERLRALLAAAIARLQQPDAAERLAAATLARLARERLPLPSRGLSAAPPAADTPLRLSETMHHVLLPLPQGGGRLIWYGGVEKLDPQEVSWLAALEDGATAAALGEGALAFCRRLAARGLLERA